jgi:hypothetical protein
VALWIVAAAIGLVVLDAWLTFGTTAPRSTQSAAEFGSKGGHSCASLWRVDAALHTGRDGLLRVAARKGERAAVVSLQKDEFRFGRPERAALLIGAEELNAPITAATKGRIADLVERGLRICGRYGH